MPVIDKPEKGKQTETEIDGHPAKLMVGKRLAYGIPSGLAEFLGIGSSAIINRVELRFEKGREAVFQVEYIPEPIPECIFRHGAKPTEGERCGY